MALSNWPAITDDDGSLIVGTPINKALFDAIRASIEDDVFSATYPTVTGEDIIDEVVAARGSKASLDERLDVALNEDGSLKTAASLVTSTQAASLQGNVFLGTNIDMLFWNDGASSAPTGFTLSGTGASVAKCGTALADTTTTGTGDYCAKLTYGSAEAKLTQAILLASDVVITDVRGKTISFAMKVKASVASQASVVIDDGVGTTRCGEGGNGTYHSGNGTTQLIYGTHTISPSATKLEIYCSVASAGSAYFGGFRAMFSQVALTGWTPVRFPDIIDKYAGTTGNTALSSYTPWRTIVLPPNFFSEVGAGVEGRWVGRFASTAGNKDQKMTICGTQTIAFQSIGAHNQFFDIKYAVIRIDANTVVFSALPNRGTTLYGDPSQLITPVTFTNAQSISLDPYGAAANDTVTYAHIMRSVKW